MADALSGYAAIAAMAAITYALRLGGLLAGRYLPTEGRLAEALERLPALLLVSIIAPAIAELGWLGLAGTLAAGVAWRLCGGNLLATVIAGAAAVAVGRWL